MDDLSTPPRGPANAFTVDVEDYFHVSAFERHIARAAWELQPQRVEASTNRLLELLARHQVVGTFFTLGWVAERHPRLMRAIVEGGHEVASHGYDHTRVTQMRPEAFRADVTKTKNLLEDLTGAEIIGYRAPTFSFTRNNAWVYSILAESGYRYSSSIAPVKHDLYGVPDAPRHAYCDASGITEIPLSTIQVGGTNLPCGGGGFFRLYPYPLTRWCVARVNRREGKPCIFYMHPWEIDHEQPRQDRLDFKTRFRHYLNLGKVYARLERLLSDFTWNRMDRILSHMSAVIAVEPPEARLAGVKVSQATLADAKAWDSFVDTHPRGTFFHLYAWRDVLAESVGFEPIYLIARRADTIVGVLPLMHMRSFLFGNALVSLPFCVQAGILAEDATAVDALLETAKARAETARVNYLELRHAERLSQGLHCKGATYVNFKRTLAATVEENMKAIPRKQRAMVRKGIAAGLVSREENDLKSFFPIYATSVRNLGTPVFPPRYFHALHAAFRDRCRVTTVYQGETAVASVLSFLYKNTVMPYYGGGLPAARDLKAYDFMYWEVMRTACESGLTIFDYGRSKVDSGSYSFKKNWGFEPTPLAYEYHLIGACEMPNRNPNNPKFSLAVQAWKKLPLPVANLIGPRISPYLA